MTSEARREHGKDWRDEQTSKYQARRHWARLSRVERVALVERLFTDERPCLVVLADHVGAVATPKLGAFLVELNRCRINYHLEQCTAPTNGALVERQRSLSRVPVVGLEPSTPDDDGRLSPGFVALCRMLGPPGIREHLGEPVEVSDTETCRVLSLESVWRLEGIGDDGLLYRWIVFKENDWSRVATPEALT